MGSRGITIAAPAAAPAAAAAAAAAAGINKLLCIPHFDSPTMRTTHALASFSCNPAFVLRTSEAAGTQRKTAWQQKNAEVADERG